MAAEVLCFGNLQLDVLCRPVTTLPAPGELGRVEQIAMALSGNGGNLAAALGRLGLGVDLAGYRGADVIGDGFAATLAEIGVGIETLHRHPSACTGTSVIALAPNGERSVLFVNGANELFDLDGVPDAWLRDRRVVSVSSLFVLPQFTGAAVGRLFARARAHGATTVLNICWPVDGQGLDSLTPALAETDRFILSYDEGRQLTGHTLPERILDEIEALTRGLVVLTLAADGCCFREHGEFRRVPAVPVAATDSTGAGDSFVAGFIAGLSRDYPPDRCARLACAVASYAVTGPGAYPRIPRLAEVEAWRTAVPDGDGTITTGVRV